MTRVRRPVGGQPLANVSARMGLFAQFFADDVGLASPGAVATAEEIVGILRAHVPSSSKPHDEEQIFEAAAFVGEWLRARHKAEWLVDSTNEPQLELIDRTGSLVYVIPLVGVLRVAAAAGYDGLAKLMTDVDEDVASPPTPGPLEAIRVRPASDAASVHAWLRRRLRRGEGAAALWRRCRRCSALQEERISLLPTRLRWEDEAEVAAGILAMRPFDCACGGGAGEVSRFLMLRSCGGSFGFADILVAGAFTRVASWTLAGEEAAPIEAAALAAADV